MVDFLWLEFVVGVCRCLTFLVKPTVLFLNHFYIFDKSFDKKNVFPQKLPAVQTVQRPTKGLQQNKNLNYLARMVPWRLVCSSL